MTTSGTTSHVEIAEQALRVFVGLQALPGAESLTEVIHSLLEDRVMPLGTERTILEGLLGALRLARLASKPGGVNEEHIMEGLHSSDWAEFYGTLNLIAHDYFPRDLITAEILEQLIGWMSNTERCPVVSCGRATRDAVQDNVARSILMMYKLEIDTLPDSVVLKAASRLGEEVQLRIPVTS